VTTMVVHSKENAGVEKEVQSYPGPGQYNTEMHTGDAVRVTKVRAMYQIICACSTRLHMLEDTQFHFMCTHLCVLHQFMYACMCVMIL
jgi:hypothetical protein